MVGTEGGEACGVVTALGHTPAGGDHTPTHRLTGSWLSPRPAQLLAPAGPHPSQLHAHHRPLPLAGGPPRAQHRPCLAGAGLPLPSTWPGRQGPRVAGRGWLLLARTCRV